MRILWVKAGAFHPLDTGGKKRTHGMLTELSKEHELTFLGLRDDSTPLPAAELSDRYATHKEWIGLQDVRKRSPRFALALLVNTLSSLPYALAKYRSRALEQRLRNLASTRQFDIAICDFLAPAINFLHHSFHCPTVLFQHNIEAQIWQRLSAAQSNPLKRAYFRSQFKRMRNWEIKLSQEFDGVITVSPDDSAHARTAYSLNRCGCQSVFCRK